MTTNFPLPNSGRLCIARVCGFTLLELLSVLAIVAVLASLATPGFQSLAARAKTQESMAKLSGVLRLARNHAVHHQKPVLVCPSQDGQQCINASQQRADWQEGIMILADQNANQRADPSETLVYFQRPFLKQGTLYWNGLKDAVQYSSLGVPHGSAGSFVYCPENQNLRHAHALMISFSGKLRLAEDQNKDGIRETGNKRNIICPP